MSSVDAMRRFRANPTNREREQQINACRASALTALAELHRDEYQHLCNAERAARGLPALGERKGRPPKADVVTPIRASRKAPAKAKVNTKVRHVPAKKSRRSA